ncbi:MAG: AlwI family type II restriction endonuclease, partial [Armatimonadetes bacterium]|nr:AlwI family type II restriction endonuclease [Armatimonadota bacterium]
RSLYTRLRVPERSQLKFRQLLAEYPFGVRMDYGNAESFLAYYGDPYAVELPWDRPESLAEHVRRRAEALRQLLAERRTREPQLTLDIDPEAVLQSVEEAGYAELRDWNRRLEAGLIGEREREFVRHSARTEAARAEITAKFDEILAGGDDDAARWLEVNTWRSLVALDGDHTVVRRFGLEEDLTPRSFAPGVGNTPDMEYYSPRLVLVPEVSLMSGVRQWTHEGAAVVDHVFRLIGDHGEDARPVIGLFIAPTLHERTRWQFFVLNRQSWRGEPVPVIPFEVGVWRDLLAHAYEARLSSAELEELIFCLHRAAFAARDVSEWCAEMARRIDAWKTGRPPENHLPARQATLPLGET